MVPSPSSSTQGISEEFAGTMRISSPVPSPSPLTWRSTSRGRSPNIKLGISPPPEQEPLSPPTFKSPTSSFTHSASRSLSPHSPVQTGSSRSRSCSPAQRRNSVGYCPPLTPTPVVVPVQSRCTIIPVIQGFSRAHNQSSPERVHAHSLSHSPSRRHRPCTRSRSRSPTYHHPRNRSHYYSRSRSHSNSRLTPQRCRPSTCLSRSPSPSPRCYRYRPRSTRSPSCINIETHREYNFDDANVSFIVEDRMRYNVHRYLFLRESRFFRGVLSARPDRQGENYVIPGLKVEEFESLLCFFYDGMYQISPTKMPIKFWINLLSISTRLDFPKARDRAIAAIDILQSSGNSNFVGPAEMIQIANSNEVERWLAPAYSALSEREEFLSDFESEIIGTKGVLLIAKAREARLKKVIQRMASPSVDQNGWPQIKSTTGSKPFGPAEVTTYSQEAAQCGPAALAFKAGIPTGYTTSVAQCNVCPSTTVAGHTISMPTSPLPYPDPILSAIPSTSTNPFTVGMGARSSFSIGHSARNSPSLGLGMRSVHASKSSSSPARPRSVAETVVDEIFFNSGA
ncbi:hypothetical protein E1B28_006375 [Marasmius oreades]|uniref:BTB domain-containing protein n=1 Tax=Marasmius oreades TaxID=181124 RepID=A0A9P7S852_9AGAR|nr:uncharacterized protein E1B28_006375 [Marasmius oreades]KAG7095653.1 hypothetical protein E1B28_006375 [Marasmius oreades]